MLAVLAGICACVALVIHQRINNNRVIEAFNTNNNRVIEAFNTNNDRIIAAFTELSGNFTELKGEFTELKGDVSGNFTELKGDVKELKGDVKELKDVVFAPLDSQKMASACALQVTIYPPSKEGNTMACGTLVRLKDGNFYALTSRHVVVNLEEPCRRKILAVTTMNNESIPVRDKETRYSGDEDLAVIPLDFTGDEVPANYCEVAEDDSEITYHAQLFGISPREEETRALYGRVLAVGKNTIKGDFHGTNGFSGTGYFFNRKVVAVHKGAGESWHLEESREEVSKEENNKEQFSKKKLLEGALKNATRGLIRAPDGKNEEEELASQFVKELGEFVRYESRNPEAVAVKAYLAHEGLKKNASTLELCSKE